jgi:hypothetical protein
MVTQVVDEPGAHLELHHIDLREAETQSPPRSAHSKSIT